ncbi:YchF/TatD family DNA exonuclease [Candidatus Schneideria nysicola]|uniref:YchF/TatD family DNA exonuclease n=1 Tax=Candidatus Schneideria nysicola TaxID=1081631 RepID=UPI001CAA5114|nr:YchF/TatD family DNA exonuclease [Candidatus Schneideria nysicola]UAJ64864.1 YchF/TatD family DNA exonuclease [Candidatus Schneideria nysicola]UAJ65928.1 YchF/TatD family DNA exonuclease [Candidatus Schneideria nysicola]
MFLVDSHCHLNQLKDYSLSQNIENIIKKSNSNNIKMFLTISTTLNEFKILKNLVINRKDILLSCGIHPLYSKNLLDLELLNLISKDAIISAFGETGLDYLKIKNIEEKKIQQQFFREHIRIACIQNKPIIIHTRKASKDTLNILSEESAERCRGILHCFTENIDTARVILDMGFYISFSGIITFSNTDELKKVVKFIPIDRLLIETDAPYLTPVPYRGKENHPAYLLNIAQYIADLKKITIEEIANFTTDNFFNLFNLKKLDTSI